MKNEYDLRKYAGNIIKKLREHKNMTQDELAEELNTTRQAVSRYENGDRGVNQDLLFKLSNIFKVPIDEFFPPINNIYKKEEITEEEEIELLEDTLKRKGLLDKNDKISKENFDKLMKFAIRNMDLIVDKDKK